MQESLTPLCALPFWDNLSEAERSSLENGTREVVFQKDAMIHKGSNDCLGILVLKSGKLRISLLSEDGRDITLYRLSSGDVCILSASCVLSTITFDVYINAEETTTALQIDADVFHALSDKNIYMQCYAYKLTTERFSDVMWTMQQILFMRTDRRLAIFLLDEASTTGSDMIALTHEQIARYMGSAREVVTRMVKYFVAEGLVENHRGGIKLLQKSKLRKIAGV